MNIVEKKTDANIRDIISLFIIISIALSPIAAARDKQSTSPTVIQSQKNTDEITLSISNIFSKYRLRYDIDKRSVDKNHPKTPVEITGQEEFSQKIDSFVKDGKPIAMYMIGFPFKSANHDKKTDGIYADRAERESFLHMGRLIKDIQAVYAPGINIKIICDGSTFADIMGISDEDVRAFEESLIKITEDIQGIEIITSASLSQKFGSIQNMRQIIETESPTEKEISEKIDHDPAMQNEFETIMKRIQFDMNCPKGQKLIQTYTLPVICKNIMRRSSQFGHFIKNKFSEIIQNNIHASVHFQKNIAKKIGIEIFPNSDVTPWHGVLIEDDQKNMKIVHKEDVPEGYARASVKINGIDCVYFKAVNLK